MFLQVGVLARDQILRCEKQQLIICPHTLVNEAASLVNENFYMDDYLDSFEDLTYAIKNSRDLVSLLKLGGFILTRFVEKTDTIFLSNELRELRNLVSTH